MCLVTCIWDLITMFFRLVGGVGGKLLVWDVRFQSISWRMPLQMQCMPLILPHQYLKSYQKQSRMWAAEFYMKAASLLKCLISLSILQLPAQQLMFQQLLQLQQQQQQLLRVQTPVLSSPGHYSLHFTAHFSFFFLCGAVSFESSGVQDFCMCVNLRLDLP